MYYQPPISDELAGLDPTAVPPVRRALPRATAVVSGNNGVTQNVTAGAAIPEAAAQGETLYQTLARLRQQAETAQRNLSDLRAKDIDVSSLEQFGRSRAEGGQNAMLNALAAQFAGDRFSGLQDSMLKRSLAAQQELKLGQGVVTPDGQFIRDPYALRDAAERRAQEDAQFYDKQATAVGAQIAALEARRDTISAADERARLDRELRREIAAGRNNGAIGSYSPTGFTPEGRPIVTNSKNGMSYLIGLDANNQPTYQPYQGAAIPKATFDKNVGEAQKALASASRADALLTMVDKNPEAFGIKAQAVSMLPQAVQGRVGAMVLDKDTLTNRAEILRQAAMEINELYGAALSLGEQARANSFLPNKDDSPEVLIAKLKAARDWARQNAKSYGVGAQNAAESRIGAGNQPARGAPDGIDPKVWNAMTPEEQSLWK